MTPYTSPTDSTNVKWLLGSGKREDQKPSAARERRRRILCSPNMFGEYPESEREREVGDVLSPAALNAALRRTSHPLETRKPSNGSRSVHVQNRMIVVPWSWSSPLVRVVVEKRRRILRLRQEKIMTKRSVTRCPPVSHRNLPSLLRSFQQKVFCRQISDELCEIAQP